MGRGEAPEGSDGAHPGVGGDTAGSLGTRDPERTEWPGRLDG